jgi:lipoprotein-releasing system permease protein
VLRLFAQRYIIQRKRTKTINIISWISIVAIAVGAAALLIILSSFNGIDAFVRNLYTSFYTDVKITATDGKFFSDNDTLYRQLQLLPQVKLVGKCLEEKAMFANGSMQQVAILKGVDEQYSRLTNFSTFIKYGDTILADDKPRLVVGLALANNLQITENAIAPLSVFAFTGKGNLSTSPQDAYSQSDLIVSGIFSVQDEFDNKYCITGIQQAQQLLGKQGEVSSLEIGLKATSDADDALGAISALVKRYGLKAESRYEQNKTLYYILKSEKWMTYAVLSFLLLIASFNMIASLSMLALEKRRDISVLKTAGGSQNLVRNIFLSAGFGIGFLGAMLGISFAIVLCLLQIKFGMFTMQGEDLLLQAYPVRLLWTDVLLVLLTVLVISLLASLMPAIKASKAPLQFGRD